MGRRKIKRKAAHLLADCLTRDDDFLRGLGHCARREDLALVLEIAATDHPSQNGQDVWALHETGGKRGGYFVEFGATDGLFLSNTHLLEKSYGWRGILCEPNPAWTELEANRTAAIIDRRCVFSRSGERIRFASTNEAEFSFIADLEQDTHEAARNQHTLIDVETVSLNDLLSQHNAPPEIDYMSIDTEGSEFAILENFDFDQWNVGLFSVEHNHTDNERKLDELMSRNGYERRFPSLSLFDAWYRRSI